MRAFPLALALSAISASLLSGCASPPERLVAPESVVRDKVGLIDPASVAGAGLEKVVALGLANSPDLTMRTAEILRQEALADEAAAQGGLTTNLEAGTSSSSAPAGSASSTVRSSHLAVGIGLVLYDGGLKDKRVIEASYRAYGATALSVSEREKQALAIAAGAVRERRERELLALASSSLAIGTDLKVKAEKRAAADPGSAIDVRASKDLLDEIEARTIEARRRELTAKAELEAATGGIDRVDGSLPELSERMPRTLDEALDRASWANPEVVAMEAAIAALRSARAAAVIEATMPRISVGVSPGISSAAVSPLGLLSLFASSSMPLFDNGAGVAKAREIDADMIKAEAEREKAIRSARANVKIAWASKESAEAGHGNAVRRLKNNRLIAGTIVLGYDAGQRVFFDLVGAADKVWKAGVAEIDARHAMLDARYRLLKETGLLSEAMGVSSGSMTVEAVRTRLRERNAEEARKDDSPIVSAIGSAVNGVTDSVVRAGEAARKAVGVESGE